MRPFWCIFTHIDELQTISKRHHKCQLKITQIAIFWLKIDLSGFARNCRRAPLLLLSKVPLYEKKANFYVVLIKGRARKSLPSLHYRSLLETAFVLMNGDDEAE